VVITVNIGHESLIPQPSISHRQPKMPNFVSGFRYLASYVIKSMFLMPSIHNNNTLYIFLKLIGSVS